MGLCPGFPGQRTEATASIEIDPGNLPAQALDHGPQWHTPPRPPPDIAVPGALDVLPSTEQTSAYDAIHNVVSGSPEYIMQATAFRDAIEGRAVGSVTPANFSDGVAHMAVIEAVEKSAREHAWVRIDHPAE